MLFLATGTVEEVIYDGHSAKSPVIRLVEAQDEHEAVEKFVKHFESRTVEYSVYYTMWDAIAHEVIS